MFLPLAATLLAWLPGGAAAHPHIFIDAGLVLILDEDGRITGAEVTWVYDELYTMILLQDYALDEDFDLSLTEDEVAGVIGFDLNWNGGFDGGLHLSRGGVDLALGAPEPVSLRLTSEGQLASVHLRPVTDAVATGEVEASIYDPEFYIAYEMTGDMATRGADCAPTLVRADLDAAYAQMEEAMSMIGGAISAEDNFPPLGESFADRVRFACAP